MSTEDDDASPYKGPALRPDGQITGRTPAATPFEAQLEGRLLAVEPPRAPSVELELVERAPKKYEPRVESFRPEPPPKGRHVGLKVAAGAVLLGVALLATFLFAPRTFIARVGLDALRDELTIGPLAFRRAFPPLLVDSDPPGATVTISGKVVGTTPWAGDNRWPDQTPISVTLSGYAPWDGKLAEGVESKVRLKLRRRGTPAVDVVVGDLEHGDGAKP